VALSQQLLQLRDQLRYREEQLRAALLENSTLRHQLAGMGPAPLQSLSDPSIRPRPEVRRQTTWQCQAGMAAVALGLRWAGHVWRTDQP
jgi:hypothetical protein